MKPKILLIACSIHKRGNSQIALEYAEKGVKEKGCETEWIILNEYFLEDGTHRDVSELVEKVKNADGLIWGTPVYFGAWTSLAQEFYEILKAQNVSLYPKPVSFVIVGAKRNGGQETTATFAGWDLMELGACMINDGYPVSQFGGICVGGLIGDVEKDKEGLDMCVSAGKRTAETAMILKEGTLDAEVKTLYWPQQGKFSRCRGCPTCPDYTAFVNKKDFKCRFFDDDMNKLHEKIVSANIIVPNGYDLRFHERTRYLRRDNYRLTYHVVYMPEPRYIPLFLKENCILVRHEMENYAKLIITGMKKVKTEAQIYEPIGYENPYFKKKI